MENRMEFYSVQVGPSFLGPSFFWPLTLSKLVKNLVIENLDSVNGPEVFIMQFPQFSLFYVWKLSQMQKPTPFLDGQYTQI